MELWGTWEYEGKIEPNEQGWGVGRIVREDVPEKETFKLGAEGYVGVHQEEMKQHVRRITSSFTPSPPASEK